jgi:hypothetical protein
LKENFDRFNFAIYKEKEMVDFRRWIIAAAVLALFAGLASAQVPGGSGQGSLACSASVAVPPQLRSEGLTELIGDIVLTCTGGSPLLSGSTIPTANITVSLGTNVTSRILTTGSLNGGPTQSISDALLLIDEPGSGIPLPTNLAGLSIGGQGIGPAAGQNPCLNASLTFPIAGAGPGGCPQIVNNLTVPGTGGGTIPVMSGPGGTPAANMYLGLVNANQVTFSGIPILPPVTSGATRVFRLTNIRANVNGLGGGLLNGITQLVASVSISGSTALPVNNPVIVAGFIQPGLTTSVTQSGLSFLQCNSVTLSGTALLKYSENFGTAFKTRVAPIGVNTTGQTGTPTALQNIPGTIYNSESGFVIPVATFGINLGGFVSSVNQVGLADYGTRLKAVFNNIPAGVRIFVSLTNLSTLTSPTTTAPAGNSTTSFAFLVNGETTPDGNNAIPALAPTSSVNSNTTAIAEVVQSGGSGTAVWEVLNTNPAASETFTFGVWTTYTANQNQGTPAIGTVTVNQSYAPTPGPNTFTAAAGAAASGTLTIPRFADTSTARNLLTIQLCQTLLLFPFVTNQNGFDTGIAISNTTTDPIGTTPQAGSCKLTFYDGTGKFPPTGINGTDLTKEAPVATGTSAVNLASTLAPGFQGYMFAQCNFQLAHGFAFISDLGARNLAMGYLALVVNNGAIVRPNAPPAESLAH